MKIVVPAEVLPGERRVAILPDVIPWYTRAGLRVIVQSGAGTRALIGDGAFAAAGADVVDGVQAASVDVLLHVRPLSPGIVGKLRAGAITIGFCSPWSQLDTVRALREGRITSFAMDLVPRIPRTRSMDALTSQALVAGYRCVLEAAMRLPRFFPLFMTAAGTVPPAKVLVLGAGVAGLQAIATARRLGAIVSAHDVRAASADEVRSVGGTFVGLGPQMSEGDGGGAEELTAERARHQQELLTSFIAQSDVLITAAGVPGRPAPRLVTTDMVKGMRPGSVIVDLAAESGGNVEGSLPGEDVDVAVPGGAVTIHGMKDAASTMPVDASRLYARNIANLVLRMVKDGEVVPDFDDEVVAATCLTHDGAVRHEPTAALLEEGRD